MIAALLGHHAEPALDQREVLPILPEQGRGQPVVVEGDHDPAGGVGGNRVCRQGCCIGRASCQRFNLPCRSMPAPPSRPNTRRRTGCWSRRG